MIKGVKLQAAMLAVLAGPTYANDICLPPDASINSMSSVLQCFEEKLNSQQRQIASLTEENQSLRKTAELQVTDTITVGGGSELIRGDDPKAGGGLLIQSAQSVEVNIDSNDHPMDKFKVTNGSNRQEIFRVQGDGNVGIGTTNPGAKLDVNGQIVGGGIAGAWSASRTGGLDGPMTNFATIPGLSVTFTLKRNAVVQVSGTGMQRSQDNSVVRSGYAFMVDGAHQGNPQWGQRIQNSCANQECHWQTWSISDTYSLVAGTHTIQLRARPDGELAVCAEHNMGLPAYTDCELQILAVYQ